MKPNFHGGFNMAEKYVVRLTDNERTMLSEVVKSLKGSSQEEFDKEERVYFGEEEESKGMKDLKKTYELSQPDKLPKKIPFQLPYRHLVTLIQIGEDWDDVKKILIRTKQIPKHLNKDDEKKLRQTL